MAEHNKKAVNIILPSEVPEKTTETLGSDFEKEVPTVSTLLRRKLAAKTSGEKTLPMLHAVETPSAATGPRPTNGSPPPFRSVLFLETLDLNALKKLLKDHKKSSNLKKLDLLGYFATFFDEMTYFALHKSEAGTLSFTGVLGFGNPNLVEGVRGQRLVSTALPVLLSGIAQKKPALFSQDKIQIPEKRILAELGFSTAVLVGVFPVSAASGLTGFWLCSSKMALEFPASEIKSLMKLLADLPL